MNVQCTHPSLEPTSIHILIVVLFFFFSGFVIIIEFVTILLVKMVKDQDLEDT